jgi:hypothetical protein
MSVQRRPHELPDFREHLISACQTFVANGQLAGPRRRQWVESALRDASLWWMAPEMYQLARHAAEELPGAVHLSEVLPPDECGLMVLAEDQEGLEALLWRRMEFLPGPGGLRPGTGLRTLPILTPPGGFGRWQMSDWTLDESLNSREVGVGRHKDLSGRLMVASFLLLRDRIVEAEQASVPRGVRRRAQTAGLSSEVRLLTWRRRAGHGDERESAVDWSHRWWVSGHWRRQPCGPGRRERRLTYIAPHIKGPEDKPLDVRPTVNVWRR